MSRHDHFPRHDPARCEAAREATDALAEDWRAEDACPGGLIAAMDALIAANPAQVEKARSNAKLAGWFTGQVLKATGGKANPAVVNEMVARKLGL